MAEVIKRAGDVLVTSLASCGGDAFMLFGLAEAVKKHGEGNLWDIIPKDIVPMARKAMEELEEEAISGIITPQSVLRRFGRTRHFHAINQQAKSGMPSIADEIPVDARAIAHTFLPIRNGIYANEGRIISLSGLVPLGPQKGNLVAHLSAVFASGCSDSEIEELLHEQALDPEFMAMADRVGKINYEGTKLQVVTLRAKEALDL